MIERRETDRLPGWVEDMPTPEQQRVVRRRFDLLDDEDDTDARSRSGGSDGNEGGGTPAPAPAPAPRPVRRRGDDRA